MASSMTSILLISLIVMTLLVTPSYAGGEGSVPVEQCPSECNRRCSEAGRQDRCLFYCNLCCKKCLCVPSGTFGHKEECPCYDDWRSSKGTPKCP